MEGRMIGKKIFGTPSKRKQTAGIMGMCNTQIMSSVSKTLFINMFNS